MDPTHLDKLLNTATLTITLSAILSNGKHEDEESYTVPLRTTAFADAAHLSIRNATGAYVEHLSSSGRNDPASASRALSDCSAAAFASAAILRARRHMVSDRPSAASALP